MFMTKRTPSAFHTILVEYPKDTRSSTKLRMTIASCVEQTGRRWKIHGKMVKQKMKQATKEASEKLTNGYK